MEKKLSYHGILSKIQETTNLQILQQNSIDQFF